MSKTIVSKPIRSSLTASNAIRAVLLALIVAICGPVFAADKATPITPMTVNINTADAATLAAALDGVGASRAKAIVEYREAHGPFKSVDDLAQVKGIGERVVDANRARMKVTQ
ncbi:MAG TPA: helix-hairpin-helix domain-containing protein [Pseudomonadales bacterium]|nr:helix-hairpin-helix domain-containing protein [Pseudomonadales bacterium]